MSRRDAIESLFLKKPQSTTPSAAKSPDRVRTGAISAMGATLHEMAENAKQATKLQQQIADGEAVISIEPSAVDNSRIQDRITIDVDPGFDELVASVAEHGQQVPILVRPNPQAAGRFQIAYGRRRLRAAEKLGTLVRAIVRDLTDTELIVAQGRENLDRKDLSFIEKAYFAKNLEDGGCDRATIIAALGSDKGDVSRYIGVARQVPQNLVSLIGPAPKAGRSRWLKLVEGLSSQVRIDAAHELLLQLAEHKVESDGRLDALLKSIEAPRKGRTVKLDAWNTPRGRKGARIEAKDGITSILFEEKVVPDFARFVSSKLDELYQQFQDQQDGGGRMK